jgi:acetyl esterase
MTYALHPDAHPIMEAFLAKGGQSFEKMGSIAELRQTYINNCALAAMQGLTHIQSRDLSDTWQQQPIHMRVYDRDLNSNHRACVIYIHGGGWVIGNLDSHDSICRKIAECADVRVIAVDYRLAPEFKFPVPYEDCHNALAYILQQQSQLGIDAAQIILCGDSAGANLAAHLGQNFYQQFNIQLKAQVLLYPVIGYFPESPSYQAYLSGFPLVQSTMHWFFEQLLQDLQEQNAICLLNQPFIPENGKLYVLTVQHDPLRDEVLDYVKTAIQAGLHVEYQHVQGLMHGMFTMAGKLPIAEHYLENVSQFIKNNM